MAKLEIKLGAILITSLLSYNLAQAQEEHKVSSGTSGDAYITIEADTDNNNEGDNAYMQFKQDGGIVGAYMGFNQNWGTGTDADNFFRIGTRRSGTDSYNRLVINTATGDVGVGHDNPTNGRLHVYKDATMGDWGSISTANATIRIEDSGANMYLDGNTIYANALMNIGTVGNHDMTFGTNGNKRMTIENNGKIGIGISTATEGLVHIYRDATTGGIASVNKNNATLKIQDSGSSLYVDGNTLYTTGNMIMGTLSANTSFSIGTNNAERMRVDKDGNVGIGTTDTRGYKLAINGNVTAEEIKVAVYPWPDYVFTPSYDLKSLDQVEAFIYENGHLPNIPSAQEVEENNGIELGEMNAKLLEKIEELTLYQIQLMKELRSLKAENQAQQKEIDQLKSDK